MHQHDMTHPHSNRAMLAIASLVVLTLSGCGKDLPTGPVVTDDPAMSKAAPAPTGATKSTTLRWNQIASQWANAGDAATVSGGRYKIDISLGSTSQGATITIMERDPSITDVIIGPKGTALSKPATLTINYAGSTVALAPDLLKLYRFNDGTAAWEVVTGTNDLAAKVFTAKVSVLCRYALCTGDPTKAGW